MFVKESEILLAEQHEQIRLADPRMEYYRHTYKDSVRWTGRESISGKRVIVYCEQGYGDIIQMFRYIRKAVNFTLKFWIHCPIELHSLFKSQLDNVEFLDKMDPTLPEHDFHILSLSLPFLMSNSNIFPYISNIEPKNFSGHNGLKIGICWEGSPQNKNNEQRNCPLKHFKQIQQVEVPDRRIHFFCLQKFIHDPALVEGAEDVYLLGSEINDFKDTAEMIQGVDIVITVDTAVAHLAGAMKKKVNLIVSSSCDGRWGEIGTKTRWYPTMKIWRVPTKTSYVEGHPMDRESTFTALATEIYENYIKH